MKKYIKAERHKRHNIYKQVYEYYKEKSFIGLCSAFDDLGMDIKQFPEILDQRPADIKAEHEISKQISCSHYWWPCTYGTGSINIARIIRIRIEVLRRTIEQTK